MKLFTLALAAALTPGLQWGDATAGVRLGIGAGPVSPEPTLRLEVQNVTAPLVQIPLGGTSAKGPLYDFLFRVKSPRGVETPLFNMNGPTGRVKTEPLIARLKRGETYEILLPMRKMVATVDGKNRTLDELLSEHYSVRAILDTTGNPREVTSYALWAGDLTSGEYKR